jgi:L-cysteine desulfhydrase
MHACFGCMAAIDHLDNAIYRSHREAIAKVIGGTVEHVAIVNNASMGGVIVAQRVGRDILARSAKATSSSSGADDDDASVPTHNASPVHVVLLSVCYNAYKKIFEHYCQGAGAQLVYVDVPFPLQSRQQIIDAYRSTIEALPHGSVRLAVIDHISSNPSFVVPVKELVALSRRLAVEEVSFKHTNRERESASV